MDKYQYIPKDIFEIYVGILKRKYRIVYRKSLLSKGSYIIDLYQDYGLMIPKKHSYRRWSSTLRPIIDGFVRF